MDPYDGLLISLLNRLVIRGEELDGTLGEHRKFALSASAALLGVAREVDVVMEQATRLRLAMSLAPRSAIDHSPTDRLSRQEKIRDHLIRRVGLKAEEATILADAVAHSLESWATARQDVSQFRDGLIRRDGSRCRSCGMELLRLDTNPSFKKRDGFKPIWVRPDRLGSATVDHVIPVSKFGTNQLNNLELLCYWCNQGKGDNMPPLLKHEYQYCTMILDETNARGWNQGQLAHISRMFYWTVWRAGRKCSRCETDPTKSELTMVMTEPDGLFVLSNLRSVCYQCI